MLYLKWSSRFLTESKKTNGSFSIEKGSNLSQAHITASASFSIWAYLFSVSERDLEMNTNGRKLPFGC